MPNSGTSFKNTMKVYFLTVLLLLVFGTFLFADGQTPFNAAFRKRVAANITCGSPAEEYFRIQDAMVLPNQRTVHSCNASDENNSHPPAYMVDGSMGTFWQSTARTSSEKDKAYIEIDLQQMFFAYQIKITFGDHQRPGAIAISRSNDYGATFIPYHYLVSHPETTQCPLVFGVKHYPKSTEIDRVDRVLCQHYDLYDALEYNETVTIELNGRLRGDGTPNSHSPELLAWLNITNLRFMFSHMHLVLDKWSYKFHHYTVREIQVLARCNCNGHANGNVCPQDETTKKRACQCQGNTCGDNCEKCCPLYNQKPWAKGSNAPWEVDPAASCEPCNCHNHSDACVYNQTVNNLSMSLDIHGNKSGGGICLDCKNHTRGINCERCEEFYYRPRGRNKARDDACEACSCDVQGTKNTSHLTFLDCVSDEEELSSHPGKEPGDCYCKANVHGRKCDQCKSEYFNLTRDNPLGCSECRCHLPGTVNGSNLCISNKTGQCPCKTHVELRDCSQCKHGYYNLANESVDGCTSCECDEGGTYPANTCNKVTGQCQCRANVIGKNCTQVPDGFYYPEFHHIIGRRDPYKPASNNLYTWLHIPKTTNYRLYLKDTDGNLVPSSNGTLTTSLNITNQELRNCTYMNEGYCLLPQGNFSVNVTVYSSGKLESIVAIPEEILTARVLEGPRQTPFLFQCSVYLNDVGQGTASEEICLEGAFSLTVAFNNGSLPCSCHPLGSNHTVCQKYSGSCACKPGVEGRDCSRCKPGYYNLTGDGCKQCSCKGSNDVCHPVTGMCECPGNTTGRTCEPCQCNNNTNQCLRSGECLGCQYNTTGFYCDRCVNETYGDASRRQCKACDCDTVGSYGSICDTETGQCACKPHVTGRTCNQCKNNTYGFGPNGCTPCNCSMYGSLNLQCNNSGNCTCKPEASGIKCSQCRLGYYGLPIQACTACSCNENGTVNGSVCSNDAYGQCQCKPGVAGRACDQCKEYHTDLSEQGCSACPVCVVKLKQVIETTGSVLNTTGQKAKNLNKLAKLHEPLRSAEQKADELAVKATEFSVRLAGAETVHQGLVNRDLPDARASYGERMQKAVELNTRAPATAGNVSRHLARVTELYNRTAEADLFVTSVDGLLHDIANTFAMNLQNGSLSLNKAKDVVSDSLVRDFSSHEKLVGQSIQHAENLTAFVTELAKKLLNQTSLARDLNAQVLTSNQNLSDLMMKFNNTHAEFIGFLTGIAAQFGGVHDLINQTKGIVSLESQRLKEAQDLSSHSQATLNKTKSLLQEATSAFEQYKAMVEAVSGELEVSMLKYDREGHRFRVKVLRGRNLSPRDQPSGKANPYVLLSLVPDNYGVHKTMIINDTLDPVWPEFTIYDFDIQHEQLLKSKLKLRVFDYDPEDDDDFMGEATIDFSTLGDEELKNWYPLLPEDVTQIESGNFKSTSGLVDVSNLLLAQYEKVSTVLGSVEVKVTQAHQHAQQLKSLAEQLELEFNKSRGHGAAAVQAIQRFTEIERIINSSFDGLTLARATVIRIASKLNRVSVSELLAKANHELHNMIAFYNATLQRNLTSSEKVFIENAMSAANSTIQLSVHQWHEAHTYYPALIQAEAKLSLASSLYAPSAIETVSQAQERINYFSDSLTLLSNQVADLERQLTDVFNKIEFVKRSSERDSKIIQAAYLILNNTSLELKNASSNVLEALKHQQNLTREQQESDNKISALEEKLRTLKRRMMSEVELALKLNEDGANEYALSKRTLESPTRNELSITFKTNSSDGLLVNILGENINSQQTGVAVNISGGKVNVQYNTGQGPITLSNPVLVNNGQWVDVYFTRMGASSALTVSSPHQSLTVTHNAGPGSENASLPFTNTTVVLVGGTSVLHPNRSARAVDSSSLQNFRGIISSCSLDQITFELWMPQRSSNTALYGLPRFPNYYFPRYGQAASIFHNGFLHQRTGEFTTDSGYVHVEFDFRTSKSNGTLFAVINEGGSTTVMAIFMEDGSVGVMVFFEGDVVMVNSEGSNYHDSKWYRVSAVVNENSVTLTVSRNGTTLDNKSVSSAAASKLPSGSSIFFGSLPPNSNVSLPLNESFVGDMKDVKLNRNGTNTLVRRLFTSSKGVSTEGVLKGEVLSGAARFYGYRIAISSCSYVALDPKRQDTDSLSFTFKTSEASGVLLFSSVKVGVRSIYVYIALWHGKLTLLTHDSTNASQSKPTEISNMKFDDNRWRTLHLNSSNSGYSLFVDGSLITVGWFGTSRQHPLMLSNPLYIGGVAKDVKINLHVPVTWCFKGAMKDFKINSNKIDLLVQESVGVSGGFVTPPTPPLPPTPAPPTCAASAGPLTMSTNPKEVGFTAGLSSNSNKQSYMGFTVDNNFSGISSLFTLELRPLTSNGLVLYIADNQTHPEQFISMEVIDGYIKYQVNFHPGHIKMKSTINYVKKNQWFKIHLLRIIDFGAFLIPQTKEYHKDKYNGVITRSLNLNGPLYIGGVPPHVKLHPLVTHRVGFSGCLKTLTFGSDKLSSELTFDLQNPTVSSRTSSCFSNALPGMGFNGSSWANFGEKLASTSNFSLQLEFRTSSRDGVLVYLGDDTAGQHPYLKLEQSSGQLVLSHRNASGTVHQVSWSASSSYLLCNMTWHKLTLNGIGDALNLTVDEEPAVSLGLSADTLLRGKLYAGGVPESLSSPASKGFLGCLKNLRFGHSVLDLGRAVDAWHTTNGCPSSGAQPSANFFA